MLEFQPLHTRLEKEGGLWFRGLAGRMTGAVRICPTGCGALDGALAFMVAAARWRCCGEGGGEGGGVYEVVDRNQVATSSKVATRR